MKTITRIEKEAIRHLSFSKREVLSSPEQKKQREASLHRSQTLGNLLQTKIYLTFESADGTIYQVHTTVWAVGADFVVLKEGIYLPVSAILEVD